MLSICYDAIIKETHSCKPDILFRFGSIFSWHEPSIFSHCNCVLMLWCRAASPPERPDSPTDLELTDHKKRSVQLTWIPGDEHNSPIQSRSEVCLYDGVCLIFLCEDKGTFHFLYVWIEIFVLSSKGKPVCGVSIERSGHLRCKELLIQDAFKLHCRNCRIEQFWNSIHKSIVKVRMPADKKKKSLWWVYQNVSRCKTKSLNSPLNDVIFHISLADRYVNTIRMICKKHNYNQLII